VFSERARPVGHHIAVDLDGMPLEPLHYRGMQYRVLGNPPMAFPPAKIPGGDKQQRTAHDPSGTSRSERLALVVLRAGAVG
jgi:hypothetical protein